jgi:general stress protein 26
MNENTNPKAKVYEILKGFSTAMIVTHRGGGNYGARPMHVAQAEEGGAVWFLTGHGSLVEEIRAHSNVLLVFQNDTSAYLSATGDARVEHDPARVRALWKEPYKVWFPKGADDAEIALIAVDLTGAEYWDNRGVNKLEYMFEAAKAYIKGEKPAVGDVDQHAKTSL